MQHFPVFIKESVRPPYMEMCNIFGFETKFVPDMCGDIQIKMTFLHLVLSYWQLNFYF